MYNIDFDELINSKLPWFLRKPIMRAWLAALTYPVRFVYANFIVFCNEMRFDGDMTGQVVYLEYMLNLIFYRQGDLQYIYITDGTPGDDLLLYNQAENEDETYTYQSSEDEDPVWLMNNSEGSETDFIVNVPSTVPITYYDFLISLVSKYKIAGTSFSILSFESNIEPPNF